MRSYVYRCVPVLVLFLSGVAQATSGEEAHEVPTAAHYWEVGWENVSWFGTGTHTGLVWYLINFALFLGLLWFFARKPVAAMLVKRHAEVRTAMADAEAMRARAEKVVNEFTTRLANLESERQELISAYEREGKLEQARILATAERLVEKVKRDAEIMIEQEALRHHAEMRKEIVDLAMQLAQDLLVTKLDDADRVRINTAYIANLQEMAQ